MTYLSLDDPRFAVVHDPDHTDEVRWVADDHAPDAPRGRSRGDPGAGAAEGPRFRVARVPRVTFARTGAKDLAGPWPGLAQPDLPGDRHEATRSPGAVHPTDPSGGNPVIQQPARTERPGQGGVPARALPRRDLARQGRRLPRGRTRTWRDLLALEAQARDFVATLGLEVVIDESEGTRTCARSRGRGRRHVHPAPRRAPRAVVRREPAARPAAQAPRAVRLRGR
ncbi:hypothetical protein NKG05_07785 [Oerskovia sp. M15]